MTLRVYTDVTQMRPRTQLGGLLGNADWAGTGRESLSPDAKGAENAAAETPETAAVAGSSSDGSDGTRTRGLRRDRPAL